MHHRIVSPAHRSDKPTSTNLRLWQAPSSELWTGETDTPTGNCGLRPCFLLFICKGLRPSLLLFVYKGLWSLFSGFRLQRNAVLIFHFLFAKDCSPCFLLFETAVLVFFYSFAKDCAPCFPVFICKGLLSLFSAFCLQRIAVLIFCHLFTKDCCLCLQRTAVLVFSFSFAKDCCHCFPLFICKDYHPSLFSLKQ